MSEEPKKANKYVTRYEQINQKLAKVTSVYLKLKSKRDFEYFITSERGMNKTGLNNLLIESAEENIADIIREQYIHEPANEGEIGTIDPENQAEEIRNMALLMLMSNRLSKEYADRIAKNRVPDEATKAKYEKNVKDLLVWKHNAQTNLIANLYVLRKTTGKEYENYFSYGDFREKEGESTAFVIDLPYIGQICVHYGMEKRETIEEAKAKVISILERKRALGQIEKSELKKLKEEITTNNILPTYEGKLYEYSSTIPIEYIGPTAKSKVQEIGLETKLPKEITKEDIQKMAEIGLNEREAYYLAIKLGCPKKQLKEVIKTYNNREKLNESGNLNKVITTDRSTPQSEDSRKNGEKLPTETKIGRKAIIMSTATQRAKVVQLEAEKLKQYRENRNDKVMGG